MSAINDQILTAARRLHGLVDFVVRSYEGPLVDPREFPGERGTAAMILNTTADSLGRMLKEYEREMFRIKLSP